MGISKYKIGDSVKINDEFDGTVVFIIWDMKDNNKPLYYCNVYPHELDNAVRCDVIDIRNMFDSDNVLLSTQYLNVFTEDELSDYVEHYTI